MKDFILLLVFLFFLILAGLIIHTKYSKSPGGLTLKTADSIVKYANAKSWEIKPQKNLCFLAQDECIQPVIIKFKTDDNWSDVYKSYRVLMIQTGWRTNSQIILSTPTSAIFERQDMGCRADLSKESDTESTFTVTCPEN